jgi:hypothetical protein
VVCRLLVFRDLVTLYEALLTGCSALRAFLMLLGVAARFTDLTGWTARRTPLGTNIRDRKPTCLDALLHRCHTGVKLVEHEAPPTATLTFTWKPEVAPPMLKVTAADPLESVEPPWAEVVVL